MKTVVALASRSFVAHGSSLYSGIRQPEWRHQRAEHGEDRRGRTRRRPSPCGTRRSAAARPRRWPAAQAASRRSTRTSRSTGISRSFDDLQRPCASRSPPTTRRTSSRPTTAAPTWAPSSRRPAAAARRLRGGLRLGRALPGVGAASLQLQRRRRHLRRGQPLRAAAGRRGRRGLLQQEQARGARASRCRRPGPTSRRRWRPRRRPASCRSSSATSTAGRASTSSASCRTSSSPATRSATSASAARARRGTLGERAGRADLQRLGRRRLLHPRLQRQWATTRPGRTSPRATGVFLVAGTWLQADLARRDGRRRRLLPAAGGRERRAVVTGGTGLPFAITEASEERRRGRGLHRLHHQRRGDEDDPGRREPPGRRRVGQRHRGRGRPTCFGAFGHGGRARTRSCRTSTTRRRTSTTASPPRCRSCWRGDGRAGAVPRGPWRGVHGFVSASDARQRTGVGTSSLPGGPPAGRTSGEPARGYLPRAGAAGLRARSCSSARARRAALVLRVGRSRPRHVGGPGQLRRRLHRPRAAGPVRPRPGAGRLLRVLPVLSGCCWPR